MDCDAHQLAGPLKPGLAVVGAGWAGLSAAVEAVDAGHAVTVFEASRQWGGRARSVPSAPHLLDNGQHILIGAYHDTLRLMRRVGVSAEETLLRQPLALLYPDGQGLRLPPGPPAVAFAVAVARYNGWPWAHKWALMREAARWLLRGFACPAASSVADLTARLPDRVQREFIEPLCVAALNTPASQASAAVFLRVLRDALFGGRGSADLLLPRQALGALLPEPAAAWLQLAGADLRSGSRVMRLAPAGAGWEVDGQAFDAVVLACPAREAARLSGTFAPEWAELAARLQYEPIVTVTLESPGSRLPQAMTALFSGASAPAQYVFDHGVLRKADGVFVCVVSGAREWVAQGLEATAEAVRRQLLAAFPAGTWKSPLSVAATLAEKRATFLCTPGLVRPRASVAPGLVAAGDYVAGPYPATLEGAVQAGRRAIELLR